MYYHCMTGLVTLYCRRCNDIEQFCIGVEIIYLGVFHDYPLMFYDFINIPEYANCTNHIINKPDTGVKSMCLSFNLTQSFAAYDTQQQRCDWFGRYTPNS